MNKFTKGEFEVHGEKAYVVPVGDEAIARPICAMLWPTQIRNEDETFANAELFAAALTAATRLAEQGYDAMAVMEALPKIVMIARSAAMEQGTSNQKAVAFLARIRPEVIESPGRTCIECGDEMARIDGAYEGMGSWVCPVCGYIEPDDMEDSHE